MEKELNQKELMEHLAEFEQFKVVDTDLSQVGIFDDNVTYEEYIDFFKQKIQKNTILEPNKKIQKFDIYVFIKVEDRFIDLYSQRNLPKSKNNFWGECSIICVNT